MKRIIYCDLIAYGGIHSEFNSACLQMLLKAFDKEISFVDFYSEKQHAEICSKRLSKYKNINYNTYRFNSENFVGGIKTPLRDIISCFYLLRVFLKSKKEDIIFISLAYPFAQNLILLLQLLFKRNVYLCQHGELDVFANPKRFKKNRLYYSLNKYVLKSGQIKTIILGEPIFKNISSLFSKKSKVIIIDHPYDLSNNATNIKKIGKKPLIVGQIGTGGIGKGTDALFKLALLLKEEIENNLLKIKIVGMLPDNLKYLDNGLVQYSKYRLSAEEFKEGIIELDYTLLLRDNETTKAVASGSFFDTLKYEKPFLSFYNEYISYYIDILQFDNCFCFSIEDMAKKIKQIIYDDSESKNIKYEENVAKIKSIKEKINIDRIAQSFKKQNSKWT